MLEVHQLTLAVTQPRQAPQGLGPAQYHSGNMALVPSEGQAETGQPAALVPPPRWAIMPGEPGPREAPQVQQPDRGVGTLHLRVKQDLFYA